MELHEEPLIPPRCAEANDDVIVILKGSRVSLRLGDLGPGTTRRLLLFPGASNDPVETAEVCPVLSLDFIVENIPLASRARRDANNVDTRGKQVQLHCVIEAGQL